MHKKWLWLLLLVPLIPLGLLTFDHLRGPLGGMVVVIDAGHGGSDPGSHGVFGRGKSAVTIREDEYVYDVACRLKSVIEANGGSVVFTILDSEQGCRVDTRPPNEAIPEDKNERFTFDNANVEANTAGLAKRTYVANKTLSDNWWRRVVFISIHFDAIGVETLEGVHFVAPEGEDRAIVASLLDSFGRASRLQKRDGKLYGPVKVSGDAATGMRRIFVLSPETNKIKERVLIELGNFTNPKDVWRVRDHNIRQEFAELIGLALLKLNRLPLSDVRD